MVTRGTGDSFGEHLVGIFCLALTANHHVHDLTLIHLVVCREDRHALRSHPPLLFDFDLTSVHLSRLT